jgi:(R,R)-butanediol dehydrogenase/meso-butanediol dehydrogenase/diacetyl reductase
MGCVGLSWAWGGMADAAVIMDYQVGAVLPDNVSYEQGALVEPTAVAEYGVARGGVRPGDTVLVTGAGPIGALVVLCARAAGAGAVYLSEPNPSRARRAEDIGATEIFNPRETNVAAELKERLGGIGVDVAIECAGNEKALETCVLATRKHGTVVQTGLHVGPASVQPMVWAEHDLSIVGTWCFNVYDFPRIAAMISSGAVPVEKVITARAPLELAVPEGFDRLVDPQGDEIKVLVSVNGDGR